jgi:hypothetical protein
MSLTFDYIDAITRPNMAQRNLALPSPILFGLN